MSVFLQESIDDMRVLSPRINPRKLLPLLLGGAVRSGRGQAFKLEGEK